MDNGESKKPLRSDRGPDPPDPPPGSVTELQPFIYLQPGNGIPFGRSLLVQFIITETNPVALGRLFDVLDDTRNTKIECHNVDTFGDTYVGGGGGGGEALSAPRQRQTHELQIIPGRIRLIDKINNVFNVLGRLFDKDGNLANWWSISSVKTFNDKSKCLIDQYSGYVFHGFNVSCCYAGKRNIAYVIYRPEEGRRGGKRNPPAVNV